MKKNSEEEKKHNILYTEMLESQSSLLVSKESQAKLETAVQALVDSEHHN